MEMSTEQQLWCPAALPMRVGRRVNGGEFFSLTKFLREDTLPPPREIRFSHRREPEKTGFPAK